MSSWAKHALAPTAVLAAACGTVTNAKPDADMRPVACNGGVVDVLPNGGFDILDGIVGIGMLGRRTNLQGAAACNFTSFTFDAPLTRDPATATFRIQATLDVGDATSFYVDSLRLTVACR